MTGINTMIPVIKSRLTISCLNFLLAKNPNIGKGVLKKELTEISFKNIPKS